jgi:hypothetical protein
MDVDDFLGQLETLLKDHTHDEVSRLCRGMAVAGFTERQARRTLALLRKHRRFADLEMMAALFAAMDLSGTTSRRQYAQALLDQGRIDQALDVLAALKTRLADTDAEWCEVLGLTGRAYKQRFVDAGPAGSAQDLARAIDAYTPCWTARKGDYRWHGINLVALAARAERDRADVGPPVDWRPIAQGLAAEIAQLEEPREWDYATALEAAVALGDVPRARAMLKLYVLNPGADAFELGSTLRQLKELYQLDRRGDDLATEIVPVLEHAVLTRDGGMAVPATGAPGKQVRVNPHGFESVYGRDYYVHVEWMEVLMRCCASVVRIRTTTGQCEGTGFLLAPMATGPLAGKGTLLVTNAHVVSPLADDRPAVQLDDALAEFTRLPGRPMVKLGPVLFSSPRGNLDTTICAVQPPDGAATLPLAAASPAMPAPGDDAPRLYVLGHPGGGELAVSLYDNALVGYEAPMVHYRCPTEGGSSGSPVLTSELKVFAAHHAARDDLGANEGVCWSAVAEALAGV